MFSASTYEGLRVELEDGIRDAKLDIRIPRRLAIVHLHLTDAVTAEPVIVARAEFVPLDAEGENPRTRAISWRLTSSAVSARRVDASAATPSWRSAMRPSTWGRGT